MPRCLPFESPSLSGVVKARLSQLNLLGSPVDTSRTNEEDNRGMPLGMSTRSSLLIERWKNITLYNIKMSACLQGNGQ